MSLEDAFERSDLVVEGEVVGRTAGETPSGAIYTDWDIAVAKTFWGASEESRTIRLPGGVLPSGRGMVIPGMPRLTVGEEVLLLVGEASADGLRTTTGLAQGKYRIVTSPSGKRAAMQASDHLVLVTDQSAAAAVRPSAIDYADLSARLEAAPPRVVSSKLSNPRSQADDPPTQFEARSSRSAGCVCGRRDRDRARAAPLHREREPALLAVPDGIRLVIQEDGSDDISDGSHRVAIRTHSKRGTRPPAPVHASSNRRAAARAAIGNPETCTSRCSTRTTRPDSSGERAASSLSRR